MYETPHATATQGSDLAQLVRLTWSGRWWILIGTLACGVAGTAYAFLAQQWWRAEVVMVQTDSKSNSGTLSQLGGLASLAGINLNGVGGASQMPIAVLRSKEFAREFILDKNLLTVLLADKWDPAERRWKERNPAKQPDIRDAVKLFDEKVRLVTEDKKTSLITLTLTWTDAAESASWANELVKRANDRLRDAALAESDRNIKYLQTELNETNIPTMQQSIGKVIENEMQKLVMARGSDEYAFKIVDHAFEPKRRARPQRILVIVCAALFGTLASMVTIVVAASLGRWPGRVPDQ